MRLAIVDDDEKQRKQLKEYVEKYSGEKGLDLVCFEFESGLNFASDYKEPFDIEMPHMDGLTAAEYVRKTDGEAVIIFITRMAQYAIKGYEVNALDFMVKPVTYFNLATKLNRALKVLPRRGVLKLDIAGGGTQILSLKDIHYVEGSNQYVIYHTLDREFKTHTSLRDAELDNAIKSVKGEEEDKRIISLSVKKKDDCGQIVITNYCRSAPEMDRGMPVTKDDRNYHGFGVQSMKYIVEKYGGNILFDYADEMFTMSVLFPDLKRISQK